MIKVSFYFFLVLAFSAHRLMSQGNTPCSAVELTVNKTCELVDGTTVGATFQNNAANGGTPTCSNVAGPPPPPDVWYFFVAPATGSVIIESQKGSIISAGMALYSATDCSTGLSQLQCAENAGSALPIITRTVTPGATYYIRFWRELTDVGTFKICVKDNPPPDSPCDAKILTVNTSCVSKSETTVGLTFQNNPANGGTPNCAAPGAPDAWFNFIAPSNGSVIIETTESSITDGGMSLYSASSCSGPFTQLECDDNDGSGFMPYIKKTGLAPGGYYYLRFWKKSSGTGTFSVCVYKSPAPAADFTAGSYSFCLGVPVKFTDLSVNDPTSWQWSFPGATPSTSTVQNPTVIYTSRGTFTVTLTVTNASGSNTKTRNGLITADQCPPSPQDCINAIPICNFTYSEENRYSNTGNIPEEIDSNYSCLKSGEKHDVWYIFTVIQTGMLSFTITPVDTTDDYDWAVYNLSNDPCTKLLSKPQLEISCNYSADPGDTGPDGQSNLNSQDAGGTPFNAKISVKKEETYLINVSQYTDASQAGYTIDFSSSSAVIFDNAPPEIDSVSTNVQCGDTSLTIVFSEKVLCNTVQPTDFSLFGPDGVHLLTSITGLSCQIGGAFEDVFTAAVSPAFSAPGTYSIAVTGSIIDNCGNEAVHDTTGFDLLFELPVINKTTTGTCNGGPFGVIRLQGSNGVQGYDYSIDDGISYPVENLSQDSSAVFSNLNSGIFYLAMKDSRGCITHDSAEVENIISTLNTQNDTFTVCPGQSAGGTIVINGGISPLSYSWYSGEQTRNINKSKGEYIMEVMDSAGCKASASLLVNEFPVLLLNAGENDTVNCGGVTSLTAVIASGIFPYTYQWFRNGIDMGINADNVPVATTGIYIWKVTDGNSCINSDTLLVASFSSDVRVSAGNDTLLCFGDTITLTAVGSSGTLPYLYEWLDGITGASRPAGPGTYYVEVKDADLCTYTDTVVIAGNPELTVNFAIKNIDCFGNMSGEIIAQAVGGKPPFTYLWNTGITIDTLASLSPNCYTVTATDNSQCNITPSCQTISQPSLALTVDYNLLKYISCRNGSDGAVVLNVSGGTMPYSFSWSTGATTQDITNCTEGLYSVVVKDSNECQSTGTYLLETLSALDLSLGSDTSLCPEITINLSPVVSGSIGVVSFLWNDGNTSQTRSLETGIYFLTVTDESNCTDTDTLFISEKSDLRIYSGITNVNCKGDSSGRIELNFTGQVAPLGFNWSNLSTQQNQTGLSAGIYTVTITDQKGCIFTKEYIIYEPSQSLLPDTSSVVHNKCFGESNGSINLTVQGGSPSYTYTWQDGIFTKDRNGLPAGSYTVFVYDSLNCFSTMTVTINQPDLPVIITPDSVRNEGCSGTVLGAIYISTTGGAPEYVHQWSNGKFTEDIENLSRGEYFVTVTDIKNCQTNDSFQVNLNSPLLPDTLITHVKCKGENSGEISLLAQGGNPPFMYSINNGISFQSDSFFINLSSGNYGAMVKDKDNCMKNLLIILKEPAEILSVQADTARLVTQTCPEKASGFLKVIPNGGTAPYLYEWKDLFQNVIGNTDSLKNLSGGSYFLTVSDMKGCTGEINFSVDLYPAFNVFILPDTPVACNGKKTDLLVQILGYGVNPSYNWSNGEQTALILVSPGEYSVTVTNDYGCVDIDSNKVEENQELSIAFTGNLAVCDGETAAITASVTGGSGNFTYQWYKDGVLLNGAVTNTVSVSPGNIFFKVTDTLNGSNQCEKDSFLQVGKFPPMALNPVIPDTVCFGKTDTLAVAVAGGAGSPYSYTWTNPDGTGNTLPNKEKILVPAGNYKLTVFDSAGCFTTDTFRVNQYDEFKTLFIATPNPTTLMNPTVIFENIHTGKIIRWIWKYGDGNSDSLTKESNPVHTYKHPGEYKACLKVTDPHKCEAIVCDFILVEPDHRLFLPTAFTPGDDDINSLFMAKGEGIDLFNMTIYNRWGKPVVILNSMDKGWDGKLSNGESAPQGVYGYLIIYRGIGEARNYKAGTVTLLR